MASPWQFSDEINEYLFEKPLWSVYLFHSMLYDRPYMKSPFSPRRLGFLSWFAIICVAFFVVQSLATVFLPNLPVRNFFADWIALSIGGLAELKIWTLFTYSLAHGSLLHILFNLLILLLIGLQMEREIGNKQMAALVVGSILMGAIAFVIVNIGRPYIGVLGASAAAVGVLVVFCLQNYNRPITFMLFLILPITIQAKWILWVTVGIDMFLLITNELPRSGGSGVSIAHSAHLGGALSGFLFFRYGLGLAWPFASGSSIASPFRPQVESHRARRFNYRPSQQVANVTDRSSLRSEADRILDKINAEGFGSLTAKEREVLEKAKDLFSR